MMDSSVELVPLASGRRVARGRRWSSAAPRRGRGTATRCRRRLGRTGSPSSPAGGGRPGRGARSRRGRVGQGTSSSSRTGGGRSRTSRRGEAAVIPTACGSRALPRAGMCREVRLPRAMTVYGLAAGTSRSDSARRYDDRRQRRDHAADALRAVAGRGAAVKKGEGRGRHNRPPLPLALQPSRSLPGHQLARPRRTTRPGTRRPRTTKVSRRTPSATTTPNW